MKFTMQRQAAVLLLLVCGQCAFAASAQQGRQLQGLFDKEDVNIRIKGTKVVPIPILPEPIGYINIQEPEPAVVSKVKNMNTFAMFPQVVLPPSHTLLNLPPEPEKGGVVSVQGSIKPNEVIIPVLPEPKGSIILPEIKDKAVSVSVDIKHVPKFIDMSGLNDGKQKYNITVKLPPKESVLPNVVINDPKEMKVIDLTGLGKKGDIKVIDVPAVDKPKPNVNIQLPYSGRPEVKYIDLTGKGSSGKATNIVVQDKADNSVKNVNINLGGGKDTATKVISKHNPAVKDPPVKNVMVDLSGGKTAPKQTTIVLNKDAKVSGGPTLQSVVAKAQAMATNAKTVNKTLGSAKSKPATTINIQVPPLPITKDVQVQTMSKPPTVTKSTGSTTKTVTVGSGSGKTTTKTVNIDIPILDKM